MSKRVGLDERIGKDDNKISKAFSAFTSSNSATNELNIKKNDMAVNKIVIEKNIEKIQSKRATYYLMPETLLKIEDLSKRSGMGKSQLVQILLDQALDIVEIK